MADPREKGEAMAELGRMVDQSLSLIHHKRMGFALMTLTDERPTYVSNMPKGDMIAHLRNMIDWLEQNP